MSEAFKVSTITLQFGDGEYLFKLGLPQLAELQTKCDAGLGRIFARVIRGRYDARDAMTVGLPAEAEWRTEDLLETIRLGLIGGGQGVVNDQPVKVGPIEAKRLTDAYVVGRPWKEAWTLAAAVLTACVEGYTPPGDTVPKKAEPARRTRRAGSTSPAP